MIILEQHPFTHLSKSKVSDPHLSLQTSLLVKGFDPHPLLQGGGPKTLC